MSFFKKTKSAELELMASTLNDFNISEVEVTH
jgi:hypothetical protein